VPLGDTTKFHNPYLHEVYVRELAVGGVGYGGARGWAHEVPALAQELDRRLEKETAGDGRDAPIAAPCRHLPLLAAHQTQPRVVPGCRDGLRT